jgi:hypothetical protein
MSSGGGTTQTSGEVNPYAPTEPYLQDILQQAENIYQSDVGTQYFPGSTVIPFAPQSQQALDLAQARSFDLMGGSDLYGTAANTFGNAATGAMGSSYGGPNLGLGIGSAYMNRGLGAGMGSAYDQLTPQSDYLSNIRNTISSDVMGNLQNQFGGMGRTGTSPMAQQAAARGFTQAYAPIAQSAAEAERARQLQAGESSLRREYGAGQADITRQQQAMADQQRRLYGAAQADIGRGQQGRESMLARRMAGAGALPGIQGAMDQRIAGGIGSLADVGGAYEGLAGRNLQEQMDRFNFQQQSPYERLAAYSQMINPIAGMGYAGSEYQPNASPLMSGMTGAMLGGSIAGMPGMAKMGMSSPWMAGIGGIAGLLGLL